MGNDAPGDRPKSPIASEDVAALAKTVWKEAQKHPKTAAAIGIGIGAVAAAVMFASRKTKEKPKVPKGFKPESD